MPYLVLVSFIWAFSPGLIKGRLIGLDPTAVGVIRLALGLVVFLPFFRPRGLRRATMLRLVIIGAIQFGLMYLMYLSAFTYLPAYAIGLFTITTPLYLVLIDAIANRSWQPRYTLAALLAMAGAGMMVAKGGDMGSAWLRGFVLVQLSNLCFAAGQVAWRRERAQVPTTTSDAAVFALPYLGAFLITTMVSAITTDWAGIRFTPSQLITLIYLGAIASGVAFFLWNLGASRVSTGKLAVLNNLKVPLTVTCSLLFFGEQADLKRLAGSFACFGLALFAAGRSSA